MKSKGVLVKYEQMKSKGVLTFICNKHHLHEVTIICTRYTRSPDKGMHATKKKKKKKKKSLPTDPILFGHATRNTPFFFLAIQ